MAREGRAGQRDPAWEVLRRGLPATKWRETTETAGTESSGGDRGLQREVAGSCGIEAPLLELLSACSRTRARGGWASGG